MEAVRNNAAGDKSTTALGSCVTAVRCLSTSFVSNNSKRGKDENMKLQCRRFRRETMGDAPMCAGEGPWAPHDKNTNDKRAHAQQRWW